SSKRSFAAMNRCSRRSSSGTESQGKIQALPSYGTPRAGRNRRGFCPRAISRTLGSGEISAALSYGAKRAGGNKRGFRAFCIGKSPIFRDLQRGTALLSPSLSPELKEHGRPPLKVARYRSHEAALRSVPLRSTSLRQK